MNKYPWANAAIAKNTAPVIMMIEPSRRNGYAHAAAISPRNVFPLDDLPPPTAVPTLVAADLHDLQNFTPGTPNERPSSTHVSHASSPHLEHCHFAGSIGCVRHTGPEGAAGAANAPSIRGAPTGGSS